ncbi:hypothetical protein [Hyunsoonleella pacifica]|uniref:CPBP family intramembrane metalloprotease n=1 Tax=Hyunsoonleella pacifica TaxID=1080224 RepID=A0A4V2JAL7_9FLAO|nr:hypothetical protein [Hyunsoonleella pacifica]TBN13126.1 hypothetical protein EYD46_16655 [Hyunsoonleella pacifica]GGD28376.1 hypothetical protein GCM10011368_32960 [Hyunsoonleella pacifica]
MKLVSELSLFLKNPKRIKREKVKLITVLKGFLIFDLTVTFLWALVVGILSVIFDEFAMIFKSKKDLETNVVNAFLLTVFIAPIMEELAFRYSIKINKLTISISLSIQLVIYMHMLNIFEATFYERVLLMIVFAVICYFTVGQKISTLLNKNFNIYLYFNLLMFSFLHAFNFSYYEIFHFLFIPILISLQFFFGLYLSFIRLRHNISFAISFHIIHNAFIFGWGLLIQ